MNLEDVLAYIEKIFIEIALTSNGGNVAKAAELFEMNRTTLQLRIEKHKISLEGIRPIEKKTVRYVDEMPKYKISGINNIKQKAYMEALKECEYNIHLSSKYLGISPHTLKRWVTHMREQGIDIPEGTVLRLRRGRKA